MTKLVDPIQGIWWLPGEHRRFRHGVLQQLKTGHFELTLRKAWRRDVMDTVDREERLTLLGKDDTGRPISLSGGFLKEHSLVTPESSPAIFHFDRVFLGAHFPDEDGAALTELSARIPALDHWLGISGLTIDVLQPRRDLSIRFSQPDDLEFELEPGLKLVFGFDWQGPTLRRPQLEVSLRQEVWLILRALPARNFRDLEIIFKRLLDLFSLLVGEPLGNESFWGEATRAGTRSPKGEDGTARIDILFAPIAPELVDKIVEGHRMLLLFKDIETNCQTLFQCWLEKYALYHSAFESYFAVQRRDPAYQEQRFLSIVQSLETLHRLTNQIPIPEEHKKSLERIKERCSEDWESLRLEEKLRHSHEPSLLRRLKDLLKPFADLFGNNKERGRLAQKTADTRNYLTHYDPEQGSKAVKPSRLTPYIYRLKILFLLHCLLQIGFTPDEARQHIEKNNILRRRVRFGKI
ncbi:MAG TPA: HEPN domain-containing protein [Thermoanaerobaculia bacterium]|nr:HEPN domain-containing protein [Thermoanaerobaculia bacterium]